MRAAPLLLLLLAAQAPAPSAPGSPPGSPPAPAPQQQGAPTSGWVPRGTAEIIALDKVDARATSLKIPVGQSAKFESLTIAVRSCAVRPPDMRPDATAWLDITDSHPGAPDFHGWMLAEEPAVSMLAHPVYDVKLAGCT